MVKLSYPELCVSVVLTVCCQTPFTSLCISLVNIVGRSRAGRCDWLEQVGKRSDPALLPLSRVNNLSETRVMITEHLYTVIHLEYAL